MKKLTFGLIALSLVALSAQAGFFTMNEYVKVEKSKPKYENVTRRTPYEECRDERVPVKRNYNRRDRRDNGLGTLIGGVAGGILGNQIGGGRGKTVATIGGAILGSIVGNNLSNRNYNDNSYSYTVYETRRKCTTRYNERRERKFVGYKNIGFYKGKKIVKYSQKRLNYIPITITINY
ncbi:MAG: glycine zipper 2TM domain-containing protein [Epsilonproteobacteria bacterium]|nr:glycine zipper 2TM domain-containing protein [Campylobacterota bacterium]